MTLRAVSREVTEGANPSLVNGHQSSKITCWVSEFITAITYLSESLYIILSALSTLFGRYVRYIRLRYYYYYILGEQLLYVRYYRQCLSRGSYNGH